MLQCAKNLKTDYGAVGDGVANDNTALLNAGASGLAVFIPPGTYNFTSFGLASNTRFVGAGPGLSTLRATASTGYISLGEAAPATRQNVGLYSLEIVSAVARSEALVKSSNCFDLQLVNLKMAGNGSNCIEINGGANQFKALLENILIVSSEDGIVLGANPALGPVQDVWISKSLIGSCSGAGVKLQHVSGLYVDNIDIISSGYGLAMRTTAGHEIKGIFLTAVLVDTCTQTGFWIAPLPGGKVNNVVMNGCWAATTQSAVSPGLTIFGGDGLVSNILVNSSLFVNNKAGGIGIYGALAKNIELSNCECSSNGQAVANTHPGLFIDTAAVNVTVNGGIYGGDDSFPQNQKYGIHNKSPSTRISGVNTSNNMTQGILDEGGGFF